MPLLDHFRPPLFPKRHWESFHAVWIAQIAASLNRFVLPKRCFAEPQIHLGSRVEVDVATFEADELPFSASRNGSGGGVGVETWIAPPPTLTVPAIFSDVFEIQIRDDERGASVVGAIELVSPGNKDRPQTRDAFNSKCASYLHEGIGLLVIDIVTTRSADLHDELLRRLGQAGRPNGPSLQAVGYRPHRDAAGDRIDIWPMPLDLGMVLPTLPLGLRGLPTIPVDLETTYRAACEASRL